MLEKNKTFNKKISDNVCNSCHMITDQLYSISDFGHNKKSAYLYLKKELHDMYDEIINRENEEEKENPFPDFICDCKHCIHCIKISYGLEFYDVLKLPVDSLNSEIDHQFCFNCYRITYPLSVLYHESEVKEHGEHKCPSCNSEDMRHICSIYTYKHNPYTVFKLLKDDFRFGCKGKTDQEIIDDICCCYYCEKCCDSQDYIDKMCNRCGKNNIALFYLEKHFHRKKDPKVEQILESIRKNNEFFKKFP